MPNSITYTALSNVLPAQRLAMYAKVFATSNPVELHGAYIWSVKAAASLHPLLSALEVALRNSIHISATQAISPDWYDQLKTRVRSGWKTAQRDNSNITWHRNQISDIKRKLSGKTPSKGLTVHDLLVAKMDFGFWDNLLRECFSINGDNKAIWPQCIPTVFPNLPKGGGHTNATIQQEISLLRELRNDIAHHSPIWKHQSVNNFHDAISFLNQKIDKILEVIGWLSLEKIDLINVHMLEAEARRVISVEYLLLCQRKNLHKLETPCNKMKKEFRSKLKGLNKNEFELIKTKDGTLYIMTKITNT